MTITLKYQTEDGKLFDSIEAAQMHEVLVADVGIYLEEWKEKKLFDCILANFDVKLKPLMGTAASDNSSPDNFDYFQEESK